ncbi:hypothetical protein INR49_030370, partial [Caranx melampygus]
MAVPSLPNAWEGGEGGMEGEGGERRKEVRRESLGGVELPKGNNTRRLTLAGPDRELAWRGIHGAPRQPTEPTHSVCAAYYGAPQMIPLDTHAVFELLPPQGDALATCLELAYLCSPLPFPFSISTPPSPTSLKALVCAPLCLPSFNACQDSSGTSYTTGALRCSPGGVESEFGLAESGRVGNLPGGAP